MRSATAPGRLPVVLLTAATNSEGIRAAGLTAGASAPEVLVNEVIDAFRARFDVTLDVVETAVENIEFKVPRVLREPA